tara:strand:- start:282 stop:473 length:192 start_codon:yes stop_codon:yes gene_type:complete
LLALLTPTGPILVEPLLVAGLSRALTIVVKENSKQARQIDAIKIALGAGQNHQGGQLKSEIKF